MSDQSPYNIEYHILASTWLHETDFSKSAMKIVNNKLRDKFNVEPPDGRVIRGWEEKLFRTGSIIHGKRCGRPVARQEHHQVVLDSVDESPTGSLRRDGLLH